MEVLLENALSFTSRKKLITSLNTDGKWNTIVQGLKRYRIPVFLDSSRILELECKGMTPADWLLNELFNRLCSFNEFCKMLEEFDLLEELALLVPAKPLIIEVQPGDGEVLRVERGGRLQLFCEASGLPRPIYQWYHHNTALLNQNGPLLNIALFNEEHKGLYWCRVRQELRGHEIVRCSVEVAVDLSPQQPSLLCDLPRLRSVPRGQTLLLTVEAEGYPTPQYEWYRCDCGSDCEEDCMPNVVLEETSNTLELKNSGSEDEGSYCCKVYNEAGETCSSNCSLSIFECPPDYTASAKVALLIGNEKYTDPELQGLLAPSNDVATLTEILQGLGFHVIALHNLTRTEMYNAFKWFCKILPKNAYAFFYFAGHGFSKLASKFMMPIDCPKNEMKQYDCLCEEQLTQVLSQGEQLQLLVMLFDCCLIESRDLSIGKTEFEHDLGNCNIVVGTATRNHQNAYESDRQSNGLFVSQLKAHLADEIPVIEVLRANQRDFRERQQQPTIFFSGADNCSLTDPVEEDPILEEKLRSEVEFPGFKQELYFCKTNEHFSINIRKYKNCFLNSVDLELPESFSHNFSVEVNSEEVELKVEQKVVTIHNIQKVKSSLCVTVIINGTRQTQSGLVQGPYDSCQFSLDCPLINKAQLWHFTLTEHLQTR